MSYIGAVGYVGPNVGIEYFQEVAKTKPRRLEPEIPISRQGREVAIDVIDEGDGVERKIC